MPRVNIYIRKEDEDKWNAIANKPEWLHEHLNGLTNIKGAIALEDIKAGQYGSVYVQGSIPDDPTTEPFEEAA